MQFNGINVGGSRWNVGGVNGGATFPDAVFAPNDLRIPIFPEHAPFGPVIDEFMPNPHVDRGHRLLREPPDQQRPAST